MPEVEIVKEKWSGRIREVTIGGKNGRKGVTVGGATAMPFLDFEGSFPNAPRVAVEIRDDPSGWPPLLLSAWGDAVKDLGSWAKKAAELGAEIIVLRLTSAHPEAGNTGADEAKRSVDKVLSAVDLPLIVLGPEVAEKDNEVLVAVSDLARGQRIALGNCVEKNYRTIAAVCISDGHIAIAKTPLDINLAKQLNVMLSDIGVPLDSIIMDPDMGSLGYGLEYAYSIDERLRLAAFMGDAMTAMPIMEHAGMETWRQKEAKADEGVPPSWGDYEERALTWEGLSALTVILAGCDIVVMCHPKTVEHTKATIDRLSAK